MRASYLLWAALGVALSCTDNDGTDGPNGGGDAGNATSGGSSSHAGNSASGAAMQGGEGPAHAGSGAGGTSAPGGASSNAGSSDTPAGAPSQGGADSGCAFDDTFDGVALDTCWLDINGTPQIPLIQESVADGALHLSANGNLNGVWYQGSTKSLVYKLVSASSFKVTSTVRPRKATSPTELPTKDLHVGGLMVRDPASQGGASENYVLFMVGHSENNNGVVHQGVEFKSTVSGCSDWNEPDWGAGATGEDAELRICRLGPELRLYKRVPGSGPWLPAPPPASNCAGNVVENGALVRSDLPSTVQVGMGLNFSSPSDIDVAFDEVTLVTLPETATAADCTTD